jgi:HAD superfamily hydrolase (TIGR01509 family)
LRKFQGLPGRIWSSRPSAKRLRNSASRYKRWVAEIDHKIVGYCDHEPVGEIAGLYVHKDYMGRGVGARLLKTAEDSIIKLGFNKIIIKATITAQPFYAKHGYKVVKKALHQMGEIEGLYSGEIYQQFMTGEVSEKHHISEYLKKNKLNVTTNEIRNIFKNNQYYIEGIKELLIALKKKYKLAILTNEGREWVQYKIDSLKLNEYFIKIIESNQLGLLKPDVNFYLRTLETIGARPEECLFIDDQEKNCIGAEKARITSIVFKNVSQLKKDLANYAIQVG